MAPAVDLTICATPLFPLPARAVDGQEMVELLPRVHTLGTAVSRNKEKFCVVPDESERTAMVIGVLGRVTPDRLYDSVIGPITTGKYSTVLPAKFDASLEGTGESEPAKLTTPEARSVRPLPEPP